MGGWSAFRIRWMGALFEKAKRVPRNLRFFLFRSELGMLNVLSQVLFVSILPLQGCSFSHARGWGEGTIFFMVPRYLCR